MLTLAENSLVCGQLLTPLTNYKNWGGVFAIDSGAFTRFDQCSFARLLKRNEARMAKCLFVSCPDVVGNGRRTLEIWRHRHRFAGLSVRFALVAQDGIEDLDIPWKEMACLFVGGNDPWKDSRACMDIVKTANTLGVPSHIGRVNTIKRYRRFSEIGADTCDGSGIARYSQMLADIGSSLQRKPHPQLFA